MLSSPGPSWAGVSRSKCRNILHPPPPSPHVLSHQAADFVSSTVLNPLILKILQNNDTQISYVSIYIINFFLCLFIQKLMQFLLLSSLILPALHVLGSQALFHPCSVSLPLWYLSVPVGTVPPVSPRPDSCSVCESPSSAGQVRISTLKTSIQSHIPMPCHHGKKRRKI